MEPISMGIAAGASLLSGIMAARQEAAAQRQNMQLAMYNAQREDRASRLQNQLAQRMLQMQEAGSVDARGNRVEYVPGRGWITTPSDMTRRLTDASDQEELLRLTQDAQRTRTGKQANELRRGTEGGAADATLRELQQNDGYDANTLFHLLRIRNREGLARGFDDESRMAMRHANRSGSSNAGSILAALAERRGEAYRKADAQAQLDALTSSEELRGARTGRLANKYNMLASRASNVEDTPFAPNMLAQGLSSTAAMKQNTVPQSYGIAVGAAGNPGGKINYQAKPQFGSALTVGNTGDLLSALIDRYSSGGQTKTKSQSRVAGPVY